MDPATDDTHTSIIYHHNKNTQTLCEARPTINRRSSGLPEAHIDRILADRDNGGRLRAEELPAMVGVQLLITEWRKVEK